MDIKVADVVDLGSYSFTVSWDETKLTYVSVANGAFLGSTGRTVTCPAPTIAANSVSFDCDSSGGNPGPNGSGTLSTVQFGTVADGTSPMALSDVTLADTSGTPIAVTTTDGTITIQVPTATPTSTPSPTPTVTPTPTSATLASLADTFVERDHPTDNNGNKKELKVDGDPDKTNRSLVRFDMSSVPPGSTVDSATLTLCFPGNPGGSAQGRTHELRLVTSSWTEWGATWSNQPSVAGTVTDTITVPSDAGCVTFTVTADVQAWVDGTAKYGWRVADQDEVTDGGSESKYAAREDDEPSDHPRLDIEFTPAATSTLSTGLQSCSSNAPVTAGSGDNDGYELDPNDACANDGAFAEDHHSGTTDIGACSDPGKDRHLFYDYGLAVPAGSTINGIQVRLDAWADDDNNNPFICVQLSWDGGATWSAAYTTPILATSETTYNLGSPADTWGHAWTPAELSDGNFVVRITDAALKTDRDFRLDWAAVKVEYTPP